MGIPVTIVEMEQEALTRGVGVIRKNYDASAAKGRKPEQVEAAMGMLTPTLRSRRSRRLRPDHRSGL
jgi:3-hydroxyacyl-CoA dehydrogenase